MCAKDKRNMEVRMCESLGKYHRQKIITAEFVMHQYCTVIAFWEMKIFEMLIFFPSSPELFFSLYIYLNTLIKTRKRINILLFPSDTGRD